MDEYSNEPLGGGPTRQSNPGAPRLRLLHGLTIFATLSKEVTQKPNSLLALFLGGQRIQATVLGLSKADRPPYVSFKVCRFH